MNALKASIFVKCVENRFDEATQKFRQLDGVKFHRPIPPPQAEPLPTLLESKRAIDSNVCGFRFVLCQTIGGAKKIILPEGRDRRRPVFVTEYVSPRYQGIRSRFFN